MSLAKRVGSIAAGLLMIAFSIIICIFQEYALPIISGVFSLTLTVLGIRLLFFYLTMARHMVSGKAMLFIGIMLLEMGMFTSTLRDIPQGYLILYLMGVHAFAGGVAVLRALEAKRFDSPSWKASLALGILNILAAAAALVGGLIFHSVRMVIFIYSAGVINSALVRIGTAFQKTAVAYIP